MTRVWATLLLLASSGCEAWRAGMAQFSVDPNGGVEGTVEGASGNFYKGLNISSGDNTVPALILVGILLLAALSSYPIQRALRLRSERKFREQYEKARKDRLLDGVSGPPPVPRVPDPK